MIPVRSQVSLNVEDRGGGEESRDMAVGEGLGLTLLALRMEEGFMSRCIKAASRSGERQRKGFSPRASGRKKNLDFCLARQFWTYDSPELCDNKCVVLSYQVHGNLSQ